MSRRGRGQTGVSADPEQSADGEDGSGGERQSNADDSDGVEAISGDETDDEAPTTLVGNSEYYLPVYYPGQSESSSESSSEEEEPAPKKRRGRSKKAAKKKPKPPKYKWIDLEDRDDEPEVRGEYEGGPLELAGRLADIKWDAKAISFVNAFYPRARLLKQFRYSDKYRQKESNRERYKDMTLHFVDIVNLHVVWGLCGLNPVPNQELPWGTSFAFRGHPASAVMTKNRYKFARFCSQRS